MTESDTSDEPPAPAGTNQTTARYLLPAATLALLSFAIYWVYDRYTHVNIYDARIAASMITISTRVPGWLTERSVEEGQHMVKGEPMAKVDQRDAELALLESHSDLSSIEAEWKRVEAEKSLAAARIETRIKRVQSQVDGANSKHQANLAELIRARAEWHRARPLYEKEIISRELWEKKRNIYQQAEQNAEVSKAQVHTQEASLEEARVARKELDVYTHQLLRIQYRIDEARSRSARLNSSLSDHTIISPIDGVIDEVFVDAAEYVFPGQRLLIMHDPENVWVSANIKETEMRYLHIGSRARITVDAYPGKTFSGRIDRIGNAATSQFALLPNPNPSGNFTKITQRFAVRIRFETSQHLLRPGMMVEVELDTETGN